MFVYVGLRLGFEQQTLCLENLFPLHTSSGKAFYPRSAEPPFQLGETYKKIKSKLEGFDVDWIYCEQKIEASRR